MQLKPVKPIILAAGKGTRMKSDVPKVMHSLLGIPMAQWVLTACKNAETEKPCMVVGHGADQVKEFFKDSCEYAVQEKQLGTGHAVFSAEALFKDFKGLVLILCADTPLINENDLKDAISFHNKNKNDLTIVTMELEPYGYGRILRDDKGFVTGIVEERDCSDEQRKIREVNSGIYVVDCKKLFSALSKINPQNSQGEFYLTDVVQIFYNNGFKTGGCSIKDPICALGVNDRKGLALAGDLLRDRINDQYMENGISIVDPKSTWIEPGAEIGRDTIIYPFCYIYKTAIIKERSLVKPNSIVEGICQ